MECAGLSRAHQLRDKKAVGRVGQRGETHSRSMRGSGGKRKRRRRPTRVARQERIDLPRPFGVKQRADDVHQRAARPHQRRADIEQPRLRLDQPIEPRRVRRQRASGLRRQVPVPEQGASISTTSAVPVQSASGSASRPGSSNRVSTIDTPARSARGIRRERRDRSVSVASSAPRFSIAAASASVLPPPPAHRSTTRMSGAVPAASVTIWLPASCTSIQPSR